MKPPFDKRRVDNNTAGAETIDDNHYDLYIALRNEKTRGNFRTDHCGAIVALISFAVGPIAGAGDPTFSSLRCR